MRHVLIAGCGYVGSRLAERLLEDGVRVSGIRRRTNLLPRGVLPIAADLSQLDSIPDLPSDLSEVVYCAAAESHDEAAYKAIYVRGLQNLLLRLRDGGSDITRLLYVSSTGVYGQSDGEIVDESSETTPTQFSGRVLLEGEERVLRSSYPSCIVRFSGIYGPGRLSLLRQVQSGEAAIYLGLPHFTNRIHLEDCAGILRFLLMKDSEPASLYIGSDHEPADRAEVLRFLAGCLGKEAPRLQSSNEAPPRLRSRNKRCSSERIRAAGYTFVYPSYREGYPAICAELQSTE